MGNAYSTPEPRSAKEKFIYLHQQLTTLNRMISVGNFCTFNSGFSSCFIPLNRYRRRPSPYNPSFSDQRVSFSVYWFKRRSPHACLRVRTRLNRSASDPGFQSGHGTCH